MLVSGTRGMPEGGLEERVQVMQTKGRPPRRTSGTSLFENVHLCYMRRAREGHLFSGLSAARAL